MRGKLVKSPTAGQDFDLQICHPETHSVEIYGKCDPASYPLAGKDHSVEYLREIAHMRPRTKYIAAMTRVRNNLALATHNFF
jgi:asparaginyl-tRNA synthetase